MFVNVSVYMHACLEYIGYGSLSVYLCVCVCVCVCVCLSVRPKSQECQVQ